jgi:ABC-2 type transport system permease protein
MRRLLTMMRKEFIHIARDRRTISLIFVQPIMMLLLMGYAIGVDIANIPAMVYDQSNSAESRRFSDRFWQTGDFKLVGYAQSTNAIVDQIDRGNAKVGIIIPPDFETKLAGNQSTSVQIFIDGSDANVARQALFVAQAIGQAAAVEVIGQQLGTATGGGTQLPIDMRPRLLYNPDMKQINYLLPGIIGMVLQMQALLMTAVAIVREREQGTMEQLIVTPIKPWELMLGKILPFVVIAFVNVAITLAVGVLWFHIEVKGDVLLLMALSLVFLLGSLGLGILLSTVAKTQMQAQTMAQFIILPSMMLSGFFLPRDNMPAIAYYAGYLMPITYFLVILRTIILKGMGLSILWNQIIPLAAFSIGVFLTAARAFHKRLE